MFPDLSPQICLSVCFLERTSDVRYYCDYLLRNGTDGTVIANAITSKERAVQYLERLRKTNEPGGGVKSRENRSSIQRTSNFRTHRCRESGYH